MRTFCQMRAKRVSPGSDGAGLAPSSTTGTTKALRTGTAGDAINAIIIRTKSRQMCNNFIEYPHGRSAPTITRSILTRNVLQAH